MAVVVDGRDREGETLHVPMPDGTLTAKVVKSTVFLRPREHPAQRLTMESSHERHDVHDSPPASRSPSCRRRPGSRSASPTAGAASASALPDQDRRPQRRGRPHRPLPRPRRVAGRGAGGRRATPSSPPSPSSRRAAAQRRRGLRPRDHLRASKARPSSTCSPPAARATSRGCRSAAAPAPSSTPPRSSSTREADDRFHLTVWRSFAPHVRALLDIAARELAAGL